MDYETLVGTRDLAALEWEFRDHPFGDTLGFLNETEHGSNAPDRLYNFAELIRNPGRTPDLDAQFLVPWLLRYMWEVHHPRYTAAAWPVFVKLVGDDADISAIAVEILTQHPHGSLRAAVLETHDEYDPAHHDAPPLLALLPGLIAHDADPDVRIAALELARYTGYADPKVFDFPVLFRTAAEQDPAPLVRETAIAQLNSMSSIQADIPFLAAQLFRLDNRPVLPTLLPKVMSKVGYGKPTDAVLIAQAFNVLAREHGSLRFDDIIKGMGWATLALARDGRPGLERWLGSAPFADGPALLAFLLGQFENPAVFAQDRILAVTVLHRLGKTPPAQGMLDLLLADETGPLALSLASEVGWPLMPLMRAKTPLGDPVLEALYAKAAQGTQEDLSQTSAFRKRLIEMAVKRAIGLVQWGAADLKVPLDWIMSDPDDQAFALYDLRGTEVALDMSGLADVALGARNVHARAGVAEMMAIRYRDRGDGSMLPMLERVLLETTVINVVGSMARELPQRATLAANRPADEKRLAAAMMAALDRIAHDVNYSYMRDVATHWLDA